MIIKTKVRMVTKMSRFWTLAAMTVAVTGFTSCLKNSDPEPQRPFTIIAFVNSLATPYGIDILMDGTKITNEELKYGGAPGARFNPKSYKFDFKRFGKDSLLGTVTAVFDTSRYTTLFLYGTQAAGAEVLRIREDLTNMSNEKANIRFFNFVPESGQVDVFLGTTKVFSSRSYKDFLSPYNITWTPTEPGQHTITVKTAAGTELAKLDAANLNTRGGAYNIYYQGVKDSTSGDLKPRVRFMAYQ
ncbi:DUF4397 domain-containing protein [Chitinophaga rhizosphaerae]|uniref:DUF4397 domain-containing protein n=1 Tax=Chitinophaga rhizosphaerae TaxID=1864947 RepID=UPI000F80CABF|nr:DUF4397 domain-containing protein [Chitinophaga rhizosphaerae]